jgi:hypothetical protein
VGEPGSVQLAGYQQYHFLFVGSQQFGRSVRGAKLPDQTKIELKTDGKILIQEQIISP